MSNKKEALPNTPSSERATTKNHYKDTDFTNLLKQEIQAKQTSFNVDKLERLTPIKHTELLSKLLNQIPIVNFRNEIGLSEDDTRISKKHYLICSVEKVLDIALINNWGLCRNLDFVYLYNGNYWSLIDNNEFQTFLGEASEKMGVDRFDARYFQFRQSLFKQFLASANLPKPVPSDDIVLINLLNGTYEISVTNQRLRAQDRNDFLTYQLPFIYDTNAQCPIFEKYLNTVLPDMDRQNVLSEYIGSLFIKNSKLKLEKALLLYGSGANGKSVFFEVINALLGETENVSSYSLQTLTNENGYYRAMLANKLVNYASEINGKLETSIFKQLVSGEPVEARLPYGNPFVMVDYAKLIFNCNELPKDIEQTPAYFRRLLIIPFDVTIPEAEQDKQLARKIIENELSGVFNWVLQGLKRLLAQKNFTYSEKVEQEIEKYKMQSNSVHLFLDEEGYEKTVEDYIEFKSLYSLYREYCNECGYRAVSRRTFSDRLKSINIDSERKNFGIVVYLKKV